MCIRDSKEAGGKGKRKREKQRWGRMETQDTQEASERGIDRGCGDKGEEVTKEERVEVEDKTKMGNQGWRDRKRDRLVEGEKGYLGKKRETQEKERTWRKGKTRGTRKGEQYVRLTNRASNNLNQCS